MFQLINTLSIYAHLSLFLGLQKRPYTVKLDDSVLIHATKILLYMKCKIIVFSRNVPRSRNYNIHIMVYAEYTYEIILKIQ